MSPMPAVSVVVPTFNRAHLINRALQSVVSQTHASLDLIVVDDGSTDNTCERVRTDYPHATLLSQSNQGVSAARNLGISVAQGDWIAFLDSDDSWCESKIEQQLQALAKEPRSRICHTDEIWIRNGVRVNPMNKHLKSGGNIFEQCLPRCVISPSAVLLHHSVFEDFGSFDEELPACEDYDLWLRLCAKLPVTYLPEKLVVKYGGHDDQLSAKYWGMDRFRIASLEKLIRSGTLTSMQIQSATNEMLTKLDVYLQGARRRDRRDEIQAYERKRNWARYCLEESGKYADSRFDAEEAAG